MAAGQPSSQGSVAQAIRGKGPDFYRSPRRVAILMLVAPISYWIWWLWQLFQFTGRESFPRARKFWWILVPFYGAYILYQQFDDIKAKAEHASRHSFNSALAGRLAFIGWYAFIGLYAGRGSNRVPGWLDLLLVLLAGLALAAAAFLVQQSANAFVAATYPTERPRPMTGGEIGASVLGILWFGAFLVALAYADGGEVGAALALVVLGTVGPRLRKWLEELPC